MGSAGASTSHKMKVYIWDMDETLILLKSLLSGKYAQAFNGLKNVENGIKLGKLWEDLILHICDDYFFYEQVDNCNKPYLEVMADYDDGRNLSGYDFNHDGFGNPVDDVNKRKLAYRHRVIAEKYNKGLYSFQDQNLLNTWDNIYDSTDSYTDRWLSSVYSSWDVGKLQCFSLIRERFSGPNVQFCVIGDGWEECEAAEAMRWPFVKVGPYSASYHRFSGLTSRDLDRYLSVIYGNSDGENDED